MFFAKLAASLALVAPLVSALTLETPTNWTSSSPAVITWTAQAGDPQSFSVELINEQFNSQFALANNVETGALTLTLTLPVVPVGGGYTLEFVNPGNISDIIASTSGFSIGAAVSSSTSSTSSSTVSGSASSSASLSATVSNSASASSSGFGTTRSAGSTGASSTSTSTAASGSTTSFDSGAVALGVSNTNLASFAVMAVAALAGARLVGF